MFIPAPDYTNVHEENIRHATHNSNGTYPWINTLCFDSVTETMCTRFLAICIFAFHSLIPCTITIHLDRLDIKYVYMYVLICKAHFNCSLQMNTRAVFNSHYRTV